MNKAMNQIETVRHWLAVILSAVGIGLFLALCLGVPLVVGELFK